MAKRILYPLYAAEDEPRVLPILDALKENGFSIGKADAPKKGGAVLFFLSDKINDASNAIDAFLRFDAEKRDIIPVNLDGSTPPALIGNAIMARNTIFAERYTEKELAGRIADALKKPVVIASKLRKWIVAAAAVVLLAVVGIVLWRVLGSKPAQETDAEATPAPTELPYVDPKTGIRPEDLENIYELIVLGDRLCVPEVSIGKIHTFGYESVGAEYYANRVQDNNEVHWYSNEDGHEIAHGTWNDLSFLRYMKNLRYLSIVCADVDLPDLSGLERLQKFEISESATTNIEGLRNSTITEFYFRGSAQVDFSPLNDCKKLIDAHLELETPMPEDLSSFAPPALKTLRVWGAWDGSRIDLDGLKQCKELELVVFDGIPLRDLSCLSEASKLFEIELTLPLLENLNGLQNKRKLDRIFIGYECDRLGDLSALSDNTSLHTVDLHCERMNGDLSWLANARGLKFLQIWNARSIRSLKGLERHTALEEIQLHGLTSLTDISALETCTSLKNACFNECFNLINVMPVVRLPKLEMLQLYGAGPNHVNYLSEIVNKDYFGFGVSEVDDWSGLAEIPSYRYLNVTDRSGNALSYVTGKTVWRFEIWNRSGGTWGTQPIDFDKFPNVTEELVLHGLPSLEGLPAFSVSKVHIDESEYLTSLEGLQNLPAFSRQHLGQLYIEGCPRLTDWSALDGLKPERIELNSTFSVPSFANIDAHNVCLEGIVDLSDLHCFDGFSPSRNCTVELFHLDDVTDLTPLYGVKNGDRLRVPAHLGEQAKQLVDSGNFKQYEVVYPNAWWQPAEIRVTLLSLDELDTLPEAVLKHVDRLCMAGDRIYDPDNYWVDEDWDNDRLTVYLCENGSDERERVEYGTVLTDLSVLKKLTGLKELRLYCEPPETLDGIQYLESLESLELKGSRTVRDASAVFTLQKLKGLDLHGTSVTSIEGVQNLYNLEWLNIDGLPVGDLSPLYGCMHLHQLLAGNCGLTSIDGIQNFRELTELNINGNLITDLSPLSEIDFSYCEQPRWDGQIPHFRLSIDNMRGLLPNDQYAFLSAVPVFDRLNVWGVNAALWTDAVQKTPIRELQAGSCNFTNESFRAFVEAHPELEEIVIPWTWRNLTDISPLLSLPNLRYVRVSHNMPEAIQSLDGERRFELEIEQ